MDRLAKKCVLASSIMHGSLVLLLIVGPAFLPSDETIDAKQIIDFIPFKTLETSMSGGGNPNVEQTLPQREPPQPARREEPPPAPPPQRREEPVKREEPKAREPARTEPRTEPKEEDTGWKPSEKIKVSLKQSTRASAQRNTSSRNTSRSNDRSKNIETAINKISSGASSPVQIQDPRGPGGGGIPYAGFNDALISAYMRAWSISADVAKLDAKVVVSVTIRRDGTVISSRIQERSGNSALDKSVQDALDRVTKVGPFPDSIKDAQKTFWLEFDPQLKPMMG